MEAASATAVGAAHPVGSEGSSEVEWEQHPRTDALSKVTGAAEFVDDLEVPAATLYAAPLRSPYAHARIVDVDSSTALAMAGVRAILDARNLHGLNPRLAVGEYVNETGTPPPTDQPWLTTDKARFAGDLIGMVAADTQAQAESAAGAISVEYEPLPLLESYQDAVRPGAPLVHESNRTNIAAQDSLEWGNLKEGFASADLIVKGRWYAGNAFHHPMEPATSILVVPSGDGIELWTSVGKPLVLRERLAEVFGLPSEQIRVHIPYIGGGFGAKHATPAMFATVALALITRKPVKYRASDIDSFRQSARHAIEYRARMGVKSSGEIVALSVSLNIDTGAYFTGAGLVTHNACTSAFGCYRIPNVRVRAKTAFTNKVPAASFRATGKNQTTFGIESLVDLAAVRLGIDPVTMRKKNVLRRGERIADRWRVRGRWRSALGVLPIDTDYHELIDLATSGVGWSAVADGRVHPDSERRSVVRGRGLALSLRVGAKATTRAYARVVVDTAGCVTVEHNAPDLGSGVLNVLGVVAARSLGVPQDQVLVRQPDTSNALSFGGTSAQRTTVQMGNAVLDACKALAERFRAESARLFGGEADDWVVAAGEAMGNGQRHSLAEVVAASGRGTLDAVGSYVYEASSDAVFGGLDHWAPGAAACEVDVDLELGTVTVVKYCAVADAGRALHRDAAIGQVSGGAAMGMSLALFEELHYRDGSLENGNLLDYRLLRATDVPPVIRVEIVEHGDGPGPFGAKGISQTSLPCVAPAIGNAILDAIGIPQSEYPFTPARILTAISRRGRGRGAASGRREAR